MATNPNSRANAGVKISQMPSLAAVPLDAELPVIVGVSNFRTTVQTILKNVTKDSIGLGKVENLAPSEMPVSVPQKAALDQKLGKTEKIPQSQVTNLPEDLEALRNRHVTVPQVDGFDAGVQAVIDRQPAPAFPVTQGVHSW